MSYRCLMVVAKQIANSALGRQHKNSIEQSDVNIAYSQLPIANSPKQHSTPTQSLERKRRPRAFNLSPLTFNLKKRYETTIEHTPPLPPAPRSRYSLRIRTDCGCRGAVCGYGFQRQCGPHSGGFCYCIAFGRRSWHIYVFRTWTCLYPFAMPCL